MDVATDNEAYAVVKVLFGAGLRLEHRQAAIEQRLH